MGGVRSAEAGVSFDAEMVVDLTGDEIVTGSKSTIDEPWELPEGWVWTTLGALGVWSGGGTPSKANSAFWANGTIPWVSPKDMKVDVIGVTEDRITQAAVVQSSTKLVPAGSVLMVMRSGILRHTFPVAVNEREVTLNQDLRALTPSVAIDPHFVARYLKLATHRILTECAKDGTTVDSIEAPALARLPVPIAPLAEQRRIVARIDELFAEIAEGEAALARARSGLETFRRALLKSAVTGELTREWREKHRPGEAGEGLRMRIVAGRSASSSRRGRGRKALSVSPSEIAPTFEAPDGWAWSSLGELFQISTGSTPSRTDPSLWGGGVPWVSSGEVAFCRIRSTRETITTSGLGNASTRLNPPGTVLLAMIGEGKTRGQCAILDVAAANNQNAASIRVSETPIPPEYVYHVLEERYFASRRESQGGSQPALNAGIIGQMPIALPPLAEIEEILRRVSEALAAHADTLALLDAEASDAARLRQAVLKAAFEGRLVPQDSNDEPAGVMLERLATEPTKVTPQRRGRPKRAER